MFDFLKTMGQGLLYLILSPFIILLVLIYAIYALIVFFVMFIKRIILFFRGEDMAKEMEIDRVAKMHLDAQDQEEEEKNNAPLVKENPTTIVQPIIIQTNSDGKVTSAQYLTPSPEIKKEQQVEPQEEDL
jgi:hypothetical protein